MKMIWSSKAKRDFWKDVDFLYENWTEKQVDNFNHSLKKLIENIAKNSSFCPPSKIINLRKCIIDKNNSLVYLYKNQCIFIVTLLDNRSSHHY